ncbi:arginine metabolism regulation protein II [Neocucurbitaria cava]|uniref:Arginine metabolism regulation protein II n=1 Tax=Neocucurbitaria cava TaxID=798079 RepID=A0A9W8XYJ6_9PLEO|nr:arginine metabolism regulation protein II [Neocucurbitaria cava]
MGVECGGYGIKLQWMSDPYSDNVASNEDGYQQRGRIRIDSHAGAEYSMDNIDDFLASMDRHTTSVQSIQMGPFSVLFNDQHVEEEKIGSPLENHGPSNGTPRNDLVVSSADSPVEKDILSATRSATDSERDSIMPELNVVATDEVPHFTAVVDTVDTAMTTRTPSHMYTTSHSTDACGRRIGLENLDYLEEATFTLDCLIASAETSVGPSGAADVYAVLGYNRCDVGRRCRILHPSSRHGTTTAISQTLESGQ